MAPAGVRFEEDLPGQLEQYRADLKKQFTANCLTCTAAMLLLLALSSFAPWAVGAIVFWALMLCCEAKSISARSISAESVEFCRWQRRQDWVAARNGDRRSLSRLQNVQ